MSNLSLKGKIYKIFDTNQISDSFKKRDFVIETEDQYPQMVKFELIKDNTGKVADFKEGQEVEVFFNVRGREWTNKNNEIVYFVSLNCWRIEKVGMTITHDGGPGSVITKSETSSDWPEDNTQLPF